MSADNLRRGCGMKQSLPPICDSLITSVLGANYATKRKAKPIPRQGPAAADAPRRSSAPTKGADAELLEVRRLREQCGMTTPQIREHMRSLGVELSVDRVNGICNYTTRSHLIPAANALPYLERKPSE